MSSGVMAAAGEESPLSESDINRLRRSFDKMMKTLFKEEGASLRIEILEEEPVLNFIDTHASVLDSAFSQTEMSETMRARLQQSDWIFSGMKTFHELNEAFPSLLDEKGERKPFEQFLNDVRSIDEKYNRNYLRAEYNFANASASMAGRWESFADDDDYLLEYRTAGDDKVRPEHAEIAGIKLPKSDTFWNIYYPPNGWNCRCTVVEVLRATNTPTNSEEAFDRAKSALRGDKKGMFRFNPGKEQKTFPDYNPYTISHCKNCDLAKGKMSLAKPLKCDTCAACSSIRSMSNPTVVDKIKALNEAKGSDYILLMKDIINSKEFKAVEGEKGIYAMPSAAEGKEYDNLLDAARKAVKQGNIVYIMPNPKGIRTMDFVFERDGLIKDYELKTLAGTGSAESKLDKAATQCHRVLINVKSNYNPRTLAGEIKTFMQDSDTIEVLVYRGNKSMAIDKSRVTKKTFIHDFMKEWKT